MRDMGPVKNELSAKGVEFLAVASFQDRESARSFVEGSGLDFTWLHADDTVVRTFGIRALPTVLVVDRDGTVTWRSGLLTAGRKGQDIRAAVLKLLKRSPSAEPASTTAL